MAWPHVYGLDSKKFDSGAPAQQETRPTIVLIHDAFHSPAHFERLAQTLRATNFQVLVPQLPSASSTHRPNIFEVDVQVICNNVKPELERGSNVVFVMHGYGGLPGCVAAERLNQHALNRPRTGFVVKNVFIAALIANELESFLDILWPEWLIHENGLLAIRKPEQVFFQDCSEEMTRIAIAMMRPQLADSFRARVAAPGWKHIPCIYVVCQLDNAISLSWQQVCVRKLQASNQRVSVVGIQAGHSSSLLLYPRELAAFILRAAAPST